MCNIILNSGYSNKVKQYQIVLMNSYLSLLYIPSEFPDHKKRVRTTVFFVELLVKDVNQLL